MTNIVRTHHTKVAPKCPRIPSFNRQANIPYYARFIALISDFTEAWAQATQDDCSIIVIQSGDHEFIGIRHRATQTLYISDVIEPHACKEPSYGKIHVGIYIAAIRDALERKRQQWQADTRPPGGGNGLSGSGGDKQDGLSGGGPGRGHRDDVGGGSKGDHKIRGGTKRSKEAHETAITAHKLAAKVCFI